MKALTAEFRFDVCDGLILKCAEGYAPCIRATVEEFEVEVSLHKDLGPALKSGREKYFTYSYRSLVLKVSREESERPPDAPQNEAGGHDYSVQTTYFESRKRDYYRVATSVLTRFLLFFRYRLRQPVAVSVHVSNPTWRDESGILAGKGAIEFQASLPLQLDQRYGLQAFRKEHESALSAALQRSRRVSLAEEFLADAQSAAFDGNLRRAVLELAIACEVAAKQKMFGSSSTFRQAIDYLEDNSRLRSKTLELIDDVALHVLGSSFRVQHPNDYTNIDYLFRCRNKVAHRGKATYKDKHGVRQQLTRDTLASWWVSVIRLLNWLRRP